MSSLHEKGSSEPLVTVNDIQQPAQTQASTNRSQILSTIEDVESTHSLTPTHSLTQASGQDTPFSSEKAHPFSPFYSHTSTRYSLDAQRSESKLNIATYADSNDIEACITPQKSGASFLHYTRTKECTVWPGQKALRQKKKEMKRARQMNGLCGCMAGYSKRTRLIIKIALACLVIGIAVGVGLGISRSVGGGIWGKTSN